MYLFTCFYTDKTSINATFERQKKKNLAVPLKTNVMYTFCRDRKTITVTSSSNYCDVKIYTQYL